MKFTSLTKAARKLLPLGYCGAVIVAAGSASRMGGIDKVMAELDGEPMICRTVRTFQNFRWQDMPGSLLPTDFYDEQEQAILRLSSKSHWDVPIQVERNRTVHFLVSHPTPPTFDGPEDRNGRRNHDEIRFWADTLHAADKLLVQRARKIQRFLSQPFDVSEKFTGITGKYVPIAETIRGFKEIIEGKHDDLPESAFLFVGTIDEAVEKAKKSV